MHLPTVDPSAQHRGARLERRSVEQQDVSVHAALQTTDTLVDRHHLGRVRREGAQGAGRTHAIGDGVGCGERKIDRVSFTQRLYGILEDVFDVHFSQGFAALRPRFDAYFRMPGRRVEVAEMNGSRLVGVARGITEDGALQVERADGRIECVVAGDVTLEPRALAMPSRPEKLP